MKQYLKKTTNPEIHYKIAEMLAKYSSYLELEAEKYGIKTVGYEGDFAQQVSKGLLELNH